MHPVEFFLWILPPDPARMDRRGRKPRRSRWRMSREYAEKHYPGATCVESSRVVIMCPDGPHEYETAGGPYRKPPGMEREQ
jgi:hypothetical protein